MRAVDTHFMDDLTLGHANEISLSDPLSWVRSNCTVEVHALTSLNVLRKPCTILLSRKKFLVFLDRRCSPVKISVFGSVSSWSSISGTKRNLVSKTL